MKGNRCFVVGMVLMTAPHVAFSLDAVIDNTVNNSVNQVNRSVNQVKSAVDTVNTSVNKVDASVLKVGQALQQEFKGLDQLLGNLSKSELQAMRDLAVKQEIAAAKQRAIELYGDQGTDSTCLDGTAETIIAGRKAMNANITKSGKSMEERARTGAPTKGSRDKTKDLLLIDETKAVLSNMYPESGTLSESQKEIVELIGQRVIDPFPPNRIPEKLKSSLPGEKYDATRKVYEAKKIAPRQAQNVVNEMKSPDFPVNQWAKDIWTKDMKQQGAPEGTDPGTQKMSYDSFIALFVKSRIDNEDWYQKTGGSGEEGVGGNDNWQLRQINLSTAISLEIQYRQMKLLQSLVEIMAQKHATHIDDTYLGDLNTLYTTTMSAQ